MRKKLLVLSTSFLAVFAALSLSFKANAMENYQDKDGQTQYGWHIEANATDLDLWEFDNDGNPIADYAAEGDTANQWTNNYAIRNVPIGANDNYTMEATFTPDADSDLSSERTYGVLVWYQDPDNFLLYWLQQKPTPEWSGQFYGRVDGVFKSFYFKQEYDLGNIGYLDDWRKGEFYDMWWDSYYANPQLRGDRTAIITNTVTLKIVSAVEEITVAGVTQNSRKFEIHQIVNDVDHVTSAFYVRGIDEKSGDFYTGLYSEKFNIGISNYSLTFDSESQVAAGVESKIEALPSTITELSQIDGVIDVVAEYKTLLGYKSYISDANKQKIEALDAQIVPFVDSKIEALNPNTPTYSDDVLALEELYFELPVEYSDNLEKVDILIEALENLDSWQDPTIVKPEVVISTPATAYAGEAVEIKYTVTDNITKPEDLEITVTVKKGITNVKLEDNKFIPQEGTYTVKVVAKDEHGNKGEATLTITVTVKDVEAPAITLTVPETAKVGDTVNVEYSVTDNVSTGSDLVVSVSVIKDNKNVTLTDGKFVAEEGTYTITVSAMDAAGNLNQKEATVVVEAEKIVDSTKPTIQITTPATASVGEDVIVTYNASDDTTPANKLTAVVEVTKDGQKVDTLANIFTAEAGTYTIKVTVTDEAGNSQSATSTVVVEAPVQPSTPAASGSGCGGSVVASLLSVSLLGAAIVLTKKKKED